MSSVTIVLDKDNRLTGIIVAKDGPSAHLVRVLDTVRTADGLEEPQEEAVLMYDAERDKPVLGYGRSGHTSYGPEFNLTADGISCAPATVPEQP